MDKGLGVLERGEIEDLLLEQCVGRIGCHANGKTIVVPVTYAYDGKRILAHTGIGEKIAMMRVNPDVCFEVDRIQDLRNWRSVVIQGRYRELKGEEATVALSFLVEKILPMMPSESAMLPHGASIRPKPTVGERDPIIFCIEVRAKSGRYERWD